MIVAKYKSLLEQLKYHFDKLIYKIIIMLKNVKMQDLINDLANDRSHNTIKASRKGVITDLSLVNQFALNKFIPNKWFDWIDRVDAEIMIIGQDWGPYIALQKF